ncbi:hypothetical protein LBMAG56_46060 [Verrucomicrobiota bacterium]|nr:hypothetical protein LBMAG56_46060 [Verrucomicrobiota bacterium]
MTAPEKTNPHAPHLGPDNRQPRRRERGDVEKSAAVHTEVTAGLPNHSRHASATAVSGAARVCDEFVTTAGGHAASWV